MDGFIARNDKRTFETTATFCAIFHKSYSILKHQPRHSVTLSIHVRILIFFSLFISFGVKLQLLTSATLVSCCPAIWETMCIKLYRDATSRQNRYSLIEFLNGTLNFTPLRLQSIVSSVNPKWVGSFRSPAPCYRWRCNFPSDSRFPDGVKWPNAEIRDAW